MTIKNTFKFICGTLLSAAVLGSCAAPMAPLPGPRVGFRGPVPAFQNFGAPLRSFAQSIPAGAYRNFKLDPQLPTGDAPRKAVKLTYLMTDDKKHQSPWSQKMLNMMDDLPQRDVYNLVFRDGKEIGDSKLYYIEQGDRDPNTVRNPQSHLAPNVGEVQSNNPMVFSEVLKWTLDRYPAQRKYLQIYTHGGGFQGIGTDKMQTAPDGSILPKNYQMGLMKPYELNAALKRALRGRKIDVLYFRACLMGNFEALYELRDSVDYALASEDVSYSVDNSNLVMTEMFDTMAAQDMAPRELARQMSIQAKAKNSGWRNGYTTMSAIDINALSELKSALNSLLKTLSASMPRYGAQIHAAYESVPWMNDYAEKYLIRDLWAFTAELLEQVPDSEIQRAVLRVRRAQEAATVHAKDIFESKANGLSILMPKSRELAQDGYRRYISHDYQKNRFATDSGWDEFLLMISDYVRAQ